VTSGVGGRRNGFRLLRASQSLRILVEAWTLLLLPSAPMTRAHKNHRLGVLLSEFLVIVVGVLVALAVDEWRQVSDEGVLRDEYLAALRRHVETELGYLDYVADLARRKMESADRVLIFLGQEPGSSDPLLSYEAPTSYLSDRIASDLALASAMRFFVPEAVAWENLLATGSLRLIADPTVRHDVSRYYSQIRFLSRDLEELRGRFGALSDYLVSHGVAVTSAAGVEGHVARLRDLSELQAYVRTARDTHRLVLQRTVQLRGDAEQALASMRVGAS